MAEDTNEGAEFGAPQDGDALSDWLTEIARWLDDVGNRLHDIDDELESVAALIQLQELDRTAAELARWDRSMTHCERRARHLPFDEEQALEAERSVYRELTAGLARKRQAESRH
jgi:hypothetical protein